jgi:hypothetical protein
MLCTAAYCSGGQRAFDIDEDGMFVLKLDGSDGETPQLPGLSAGQLSPWICGVLANEKCDPHHSIPQSRCY